MSRRAALIGTMPSAVRKDRPTIDDPVKLIRESGLFDDAFYVDSYGPVDPILRIVDPVSHYLSIGAGKSFNPSPVFDTEQYLRENPELYQTKENPLLHYCRVHPNDYFYPNLKDSPRVLSVYPTWEPDFANLPLGRSKHDPPRLNVIIPVHGARHETLWSIYSVLSSDNATPFELIVIDDSTPDKTLSAELDILAGRGLFTLCRNKRNLGFPRAVNRAMALYPSRSVILLNSDTLVHGDWVDRLYTHAKPGVATVTPFSNNASLCSYPVIFEENGLPEGVTSRELDRIAARLNRGRAVEVPTGVGFCMFISRSALDAVGSFDHRVFGKGYGEENDFCFRAEAAGFRNLHALDVFVYHKGQASFGNRAAALSERNRFLLRSRHPGYSVALRRFALADPSSDARRELDIAIVARKRVKYRILCLVGPDGKLTDRALRSRTGEELILGAPEYLRNSVRIKGVLSGSATPNLRMLGCTGRRSELEQFLERARVSCVELHSPESYSEEVSDSIRRTCRRLGITFWTLRTRPRAQTQTQFPRPLKDRRARSGTNSTGERRGIREQSDTR